MSLLRRVGLKWLPVFGWMAIIFLGSGDSGSFRHSSRLLEPLVRWIVPSISEPALRTVVVGVRKASHLTEFAILALLALRAIRSAEDGSARPWAWKDAGIALLLATAYAASDELHQAFVPHREASLADVAMDTCGAALGLILSWFLERWRRSG